MLNWQTLRTFIAMMSILSSMACTPDNTERETETTPPAMMMLTAGTRGDSMASAGMPADMTMGDENDTNEPEPRIVILPDMLEFLFSASEGPSPDVFTIQNQGDVLLTIRTLRMERQAGELSNAFQLIDPPELPLRLMPGASADVKVAYEPPDNMARTADFVVESDDPNRGYIRQRVAARPLIDTVSISPTMLNLGQIPAGTISGEFSLSVKNGDLTHVIDTMTVEDGARFVVEAEDGAPVDGRQLDKGEQVRLLVKYDNRDNNLAEGMNVRKKLTITFADNRAEPLEAMLSASGAANRNCQVIFTNHVPETPFTERTEEDRMALERFEFDYVRINTMATKKLDITNISGVPCRIKATTLEVIRQDEMGENRFEITQPLELPNQILEPMATETMEITYLPVVPFIQGEEWRITVSYNADANASTATNLTADINLFGIGSQALLGHTMGGTTVNFADVSALPIEGVRDGTCASAPKIIRAENVGFVPFCIREYRLEGDDCNAFLMTAGPTIEDECYQVTRTPARSAEFVFQFQPLEVGTKTCSLVITGDTDDEDVLRFTLEGKGVDTDQSSDERVMGEVDRRRKQTWDLSLDAVAETIIMNWTLPADLEAGREEMNGQTTLEALDRQDNSIETGRTKKIVVRSANLPPEGANLDISYDRWCFDPQ